MAEAPGSGRRSLYKAVGSAPWKEVFRQGCLERMRNSRDRLLNRYRQAGSSMPRRCQNTLLVQEVMEEEWSALQSVDSCPEVLTQLEELLDVAELEEIQQEMADQERCILREYEKSLQFDEKCLSVMLAEWEANPLICPVCTKSNVSVSGGVVTCPCGLYLPSHYFLNVAFLIVVKEESLVLILRRVTDVYDSAVQSPELTVQKLRACLEDRVSEHSAHCPHTPAFSVAAGPEETPSLLMSCVACDTWAVIL